MKYIFTIIVLIVSHQLVAQEKKLNVDSTAMMDSIMKEMDSYLDSLTLPKSYLDVSFGIGTGFYNFKSASLTYNSERKLLFSPDLSYYHKSGLGLSVATYILSENGKLNNYQYALTGSYDYIQPRRWASGIAYSRYFTKKNLSFYTTPLENEIAAYFSYKKWWLQPGIVLCYGWGSKTEFEKKKLDILRNRLRLNPLSVVVRNDESIRDFSMLFSVRHDFNRRKIISSRDLLTITPILLLSSGTQNFGFNTSFQSRYTVLNNFFPSNNNITDKKGLDFQSTTLVLRLNYSIGKFYLQPQALLDYYLHSGDNRLNTAYSIITGISF